MESNALIMRNKPDIDEIDIDDLYNNLRVYEDEMKRSSSSTSTSQNLAFLSSKNTSSTNEVSTASGDFGVSTAGGISQVSTTPCAHDVACSFFAQPTTSPQLENEDFQQIDEDDLEELDLRWQVAMLTVRVKKFIQKTGRNLDFKEKRPVSLDKSKIKCYNCHRKGHFARECRSGRNQGRRSYGDNGRSNAPTNESSSQALVAQDGLGSYDWSNDFEVEPVNYALMAISSSSSSSSSDNEVQKYSKQCLESFKTLQKNYDSEREKHSRARLEIQGYELALESLESRILVHEKNELAWGEKYEFQNYELKCREIKINNLNLELEKVVKERDELKLKIEKWEESSKNLDELLNSQMSARDKTSLGYGTQLNEMSNNSKTDSVISLSVFDVRLSDEENTPANDRFSKAYGFHVVPPPITGNFLTTRSHISFASLDEYAIRKKIIKDKVIIEDWNSDDEDDVSEVQNSLSGISEILFTGSLQCVKNSVLFTETECLILSPSFKLLDKSQVVLRAPRKDDVYSFLWRLQELASLKQTVLSKANGIGKDFPNPFMAGSLPKTIKQSNDPYLSRGYTLRSGEDSLELMELMANCIQIVYIVRKKNREISAEGSMQQHDLTVLVNKLNDRIDGLEKDLQQTKKIYSTALTKLVLRVKKLEYKLKSSNARRKAKIILFDDEEIAEDSSK
ncbi:putative ribonuclease H-like domain-containing protein [Tanacetum coccineum]